MYSHDTHGLKTCGCRWLSTLCLKMPERLPDLPQSNARFLRSGGAIFSDELVYSSHAHLTEVRTPYTWVG